MAGCSTTGNVPLQPSSVYLYLLYNMCTPKKHNPYLVDNKLRRPCEQDVFI